jgi:hypothetical protein
MRAISVWVMLSISLHLLPQLSQAKPWKQIRSERGIKVYQREEKGRDLPSFKGVGNVEGDMYSILAVLRDGARRKEWMTRSGVTRVLKRTSVFEAISYQQTLAPFPVSDREVIMHTKVYLRKEPQEIIATFNGVKWERPIKGVDRDDFVWMPYLKGYWRLTPKGPNTTEVTYMVNTDPGGLLPNFLIRRISRDLPYWTLIGLRKQVKRSAGRYDEFLSQYDPNRAGESLKGAPPEPPASVISQLD